MQLCHSSSLHQRFYNISLFCSPSLLKRLKYSTFVSPIIFATNVQYFLCRYVNNGFVHFVWWCCHTSVYVANCVCSRFDSWLPLLQSFGLDSQGLQNCNASASVIMTQRLWLLMHAQNTWLLVGDSCHSAKLLTIAHTQ